MQTAILKHPVYADSQPNHTISTPPALTRGSITARPYQEENINEVRSLFSQGEKRVLYVASTGSGKTVFMSLITVLLLEKNSQASIVIGIHRQALISSTIKRLKEAGIPRSDIAIVQGQDRPALDARVWIVMIQTLDSWIDSNHPYLEMMPQQFALGFLDEAHETAFHAAGQWLMKRSSLHIGVTATPERSNPQESLGFFYKHAIQSPSHAELVRLGQLRPCIYTRLNFREDKQQAIQGFEEIVSDEEDSPSLAKLVAEPDVQERVITLSEEAILDYASKNKGVRKTIVFAPSQATAKSLAERWGEKLGKGRVGYILSQGCGVVGTAQNDRDSIVDLFALPDSGLDVIVSVSAIAVGFDVPIASVAVFLRRIGGRAMWTQSVGRVARLYPDCSYSLVIDFADNIKTDPNSPGSHQPVEANEWDSKEYLAIPDLKEKGEGLTKLCPVCDKVHAITVRTCGKVDKNTGHVFDGCGYIFPRKELEQQMVDWDKAQLKELHTALWVDIASTPEEKNARFYEVVRDKWINLHTNPHPDPKKADRVYALKNWIREFEEEIQAGNPDFKAPKDAVSYKVLGNCFQGVPEAKLLTFQARYAGQVYWNNLVLEIGREEILFMCSPKYDRSYVKWAETLKARRAKESEMCDRAFKQFDPEDF